MDDKAGGSAVQIVGREAELETLEAFVEGSAPALVLVGGPGIGKTTLWEAGIAEARRREVHVLAARASGAEARLAFCGLIDLLDEVPMGELAGVSAPQLDALEVALLRRAPRGAAPEPGAIAIALLNGLRALASTRPLLVAVDDVQWLDPPSADALAFVVRRLEPDAVRVLLAKRPGPATAVERALETRRVERLELVPLSLGAIRRLLSDRLGLSLPRHLLRQLTQVTVGNPLFALELGRTLTEEGLPGVGQGLPVPDAVEGLLGTRVARLPAASRRLLLAIALNSGLRVDQLVEIADLASVEEARETCLIVVEGERVRASHPLLPAVARKHARPAARRELHRELARVVGDDEVRARHLALAASRPDEALAATLAGAAAAAGRRGARQEAAELGEHALRLTPPRSEERSERLLSFASDLVLAGEPQRATELLEPALEGLPPGLTRARAWALLAGGKVERNEDLRRCFERALDESRNEPAFHASVLGRMARNAAVIRVERLGEADGWAREALAGAGTVDEERLGLYAVAWTRALRGLAVDDLCARFHAVSDAAFPIASSPDRVEGQRLTWRGQIDDARGVLTRLLAAADERGELYSYALLRLHVCQLEERAGDWDAAERLLDDWEADRELLPWPMYERCRALLAAGRGDPEEVQRWATETIDRAEATGSRWDLLEALRARGVAALLAHDPASAAESLREVWAYTQREGVDEPGVFPVAFDLVESLVELGELDEARGVADRLRRVAHELEHPWARVGAEGSDALIAVGERSGDDDAPGTLERTAAAYGDLGLRFDGARTLLLLGRVQRRRRKWAASRSAFQQAATTFDEVGSPGWAAEARSELALVGARRPAATGELTPAESRVVELAADGLSNKEIATALFVTVKTVELHLSHAYAKLGVSSRSQLVRRLSIPGQGRRS